MTILRTGAFTITAILALGAGVSQAAHNTLNFSGSGTMGPVLSCSNATNCDPLGLNGHSFSFTGVIDETISPTACPSGVTANVCFTVPSGALMGSISGQPPIVTNTPSTFALTLPGGTANDVLEVIFNVPFGTLENPVTAVLELAPNSFTSAALTHPGPFAPSPQTLTVATGAPPPINGSSVAYCVSSCSLGTSVLGLAGTTAAYTQVAFKFTGFDPPGSSETHAFAVNNSGNIAGYYKDSSNLYVGFQRFKNGVFSKPLQKAGDSLYLTGFNDSSVLTGYYYPPNSETSFTWAKGVFTDFAYKSFQTQVDGINNKADLAGMYVETPSLYPGFLYIAASKKTITFSATGAAATFANGVNNKDVVVGSYTTTIPYGPFQGFIRETNGSIANIGFPGATQTEPEQINDCSVIVGTFYDSAGLFHGFYGNVNQLIQLDYPGAAQTSVEGINNKLEITGSYIDSAGLRHGFLATPPVGTCGL